VPSKPKNISWSVEVASSIWNFCKHVPINVAKKVVNSSLSLFASKDKELPQLEYEEQQPPFVLIKTNSALKDFVEQYTIDGRPRYDPESLLKAVKEVVSNTLQSRRQMILKCMMKEEEEEKEEEEFIFHKQKYR